MYVRPLGSQNTGVELMREVISHLDPSFLLRKAWVDLKQGVGLSVRGDKRHFCDRIFLGVTSGLISPDSCLAASFRRDGFGSQVLSRLSVQATAAVIGLKYVHRPFREIAHAEHGDWVSCCEDYFRLSDHPSCVQSNLPAIGLFDFVRSPKIWKEPHIIEVPHMYAITDRIPEAFRRCIPARAEHKFGKVVRVGIHIRRGDVSEAQTRDRFVSANVYLRRIESIRKVLLSLNLDPEIHIYSNGTEEEFEQLSKAGVELHLTLGAIETMSDLIKSDIILTAKSTFSYVAGLFNPGIVVYDDFARSPLPEWMRLNRGVLNEGELYRRLLGRI